ncbi:glucosaminidase domain-containing protein [Flavisolibacter ginsenosidimutans]|uniref:Peptidoglycan hydrolase n=1 Tax=Flavisolibacter ginsenosidimutans TaxID=661481 RepID=A0A5B8UIM9_9BACT|nr:glucosaminidase domain-containing protein [Flavisolibacter ginsenosidimutans]QEC56514.1 LysM peptidoglycan-binding domain-containing protein [Flavisolibacter ginsenosidimutans]
MKKRILFLLFFAGLAALTTFAQSKETVQAYVDKYKVIAIEEMQRTGVPAAITLAQGIHESGAGTSDLVLKSNNHFGIKCKTEWDGDKVYHDDDARGECFRKYDDPAVSYRDHSDFLRTRPYYASLFKLDPMDYEGWAYGLKKAGYATNPRYPQILIKLIQDFNLQDYTLIALGKKPLNENSPQWTKSSESINTAIASNAVAQKPKAAYPSGVFKINDTKVVFISKGTSYLKVAEDNSVSLARLLEFNDMKDGDVAQEDGLVFLQRKRKSGGHETHTMLPGETLYDVAQAEGIRLESLLQYNLLTPNAQPAEGERLYLTTSAPSAPKLAAEKPKATLAVYKTDGPASQPAFVMHVVEPKETVYSIAKKYNVNVDNVKAWNNMETNDLKIGQQIRINKTR